MWIMLWPGLYEGFKKMLCSQTMESEQNSEMDIGM